MKGFKQTYRFVLLFMLCAVSASAQNVRIDSMRAELETVTDDSVLQGLYYELSVALARINPEEARSFGLTAAEVAEQLRNKSLIGKSYRNAANLYSQKPDYDSAFYYYDKSTAILEQSTDRKSLGLTHSNRGSVLRSIGEYGEARIYYTKYLRIAEELADSAEIASSMGRLGLLAYYEGDFTSAIEYYVNAADVQERLGDSTELAYTYSNYAQAKAGLGDQRESIVLYRSALQLFGKDVSKRVKGSIFNNIGSMYEELDIQDSALHYFYMADTAFVEANIENFRGATLSNIGKILGKQGRFEEAEKSYLQSIKIRTAFKDRDGLVGSYMGIAEIYSKTGKHGKALTNAKKAVKIAEDINSLGRSYNANTRLYNVYKAKGDFKRAFEQLNAVGALQDSVFGQEKMKAISELEKRYQSDKKAREIELLEKENALQKAKLKEADAMVMQKEAEALESSAEFRMILIVSGLVLILFVLIVIGARTKKRANNKLIKQKEEIEKQNSELTKVNSEINAQNAEIEKRNTELSSINKVLDNQRLELEIRNKEITDSIHYAKRLQTAILPPNSLVEKLLPDAFVLYLPKDIVSGDFYWIEQKDGRTYFAAVDCTGHGVPGALVSMVGHNGLHRAVHEFGMITPAEILDKLNELVLEALYENSEQEINDGMDIALCMIEPNSNQLQFAGAYNPLYILPPAGSDAELVEIKGDKQPIGPSPHRKPFTNHVISVEPGSSVYVFSDGYYDQFGGVKGKKLKSGGFKKLLISLHEANMRTQNEQLGSAFIEWRGDNEQIDDVCVIGVRV